MWHSSLRLVVVCIDVFQLLSGRMIPEDLDEKINETKCGGRVPFFVNSTCGTTVLGSFDPLDKIADVCEKYKIWMHVDVSILPYNLMCICSPCQVVLF